MAKTYYNRIKEVIVEKKSSNKDLADYMGYEKPTISNWCTNTNQPTIQDLYRIAEFFKVDIRSLLVPTSWEPGPSPSEIVKQKKEQFLKKKSIHLKGKTPNKGKG